MKQEKPSFSDEEPEKVLAVDEKAAIDGFSTTEIRATFDDALRPDEEEIVNRLLDNRTIEDALKILEDAIVNHQHDLAVPTGKIAHLEELLQGPGKHSQEDWEHDVKFQAYLIHDWSIYPEVRVAVSPVPDEEPHNPETLRVYVLGLFWSMAATCLDTFFMNRFPTISLSSMAIQLFITWSGQLWAKLPLWSIPIGFGKRLTINQGKWTFKEQMLSQLLASVSIGAPYSYYAITAQSNKNFYGFSDVDFGYITMLTFSSQFMGFGVSGIMRPFLVYPQQCIWYGVLPTITYCRTLSDPEKRENINGWKLLRYEAFALCALIMFVWYWITNFVFQALQYFDWPTWIAPENVKLQNMCGMLSGLAINPVPTFDWNTMNNGGMVAPFWATSAGMFGMLISLFAILVVWFTNVRYTGHLPVNTNHLYANDGSLFDVRKLLKNGLLDEEKYQKYTLPFYSAGNLVVYGAFFMVYPAMVVYAILNYGRHIQQSFRILIKSFKNPRYAVESGQDRFCRYQRRYQEVPQWWFLVILLGALALAIATVEHYKFTETPVWTIFFAIVIALIFTVPFGILYSTSNISMDINVLFELIIGYAIPGNGNALMVSKVFATNFLSQTDNYVTNQKQGHYTGISPRSLFRAQMLSVFCSTWVQIGIMHWQTTGGISKFCDKDNASKFTCAGSRTFFNAGVLWGTIGPKRVFSGLYPTMKYCFLIGALYPVPFFLTRKIVAPYIERNAEKGGVFTILNKIRKFFSAIDANEMIYLTGSLQWAPYNLAYYLPNWYLSLAFNCFIRKRYHAWWKKYNYIIYVAFTVGTAYAALIAFFSTQYKHMAEINWWGNSVSFNVGDASGMPRLDIPEVGYFGPAPGSYP